MRFRGRRNDQVREFDAMGASLLGEMGHADRDGRIETQNAIAKIRLNCPAQPLEFGCPLAFAFSEQVQTTGFEFRQGDDAKEEMRTIPAQPRNEAGHKRLTATIEEGDDVGVEEIHAEALIHRENRTRARAPEGSSDAQKAPR